MSKKAAVAATPAAAASTADKEHEERTDVEEDEEEEEPSVEEEDKSKAEEASAMNSMNDTNDDDKDDDVDVGTLRKLLTSLKVQEEQDKEATVKREKELAAIKVSKEDVAFIVSELLLTPAQAERKLREAHGDLHGCLKSALRLP
ncbi:hypothetical protein DYB37_007885 [Aphanomyces astaci]|uniref:Nascent polypeptide-associated complex subunit alpha-like UBA domain-containing protein n=1 Tax=Aphanomyces astaci TaxID=112090 RepID=A0A397BF75_APHAT|nr:hypothetical protein DYB36_009825 [Aphanomyces astaci]RHY96791.1 hypothetical protein DYB35_003250 [Aphanomyces astaci]RHZ32340.1 hypothetical protein DYB37_007885 [Aphanomyces astaci]